MTMTEVNGHLPSTKTPFGHGLRKYFLFDDGFTNLNHGSFGTYPRSVRDALRTYQDRAEARPDAFMRYDSPKLLDESRKTIASFLDVPTDTVVFLQNATTGINTVLRNLVFEPGDKIIYFATIYGACRATIEYVTETTPAEAVEVEYTYPVSDEWLVQEFRRIVKREKQVGSRVRIAIFDTIVSLPCLRMPFEALTKVCKEEGVLSCVDGAHGVGHIPLDLAKWDPDFFVSNCHKWLYVPRGCAVFYVPLRNQALLRSSLPTSHGFVARPTPGSKKTNNPLPAAFSSPFVALFGFTGTVDPAPNFCIPAAIAFRRDVLGGEEAIYQYCFQLAKEGGSLIARHLGTEVLENEKGMGTGIGFANVRLPIDVQDVGEENAGKVTHWIEKSLVDDYDTFIAVVFYGGAWWARLSAQTYLEISDFQMGAEALEKVCERVRQGAWKTSLPLRGGPPLDALEE